MSTQVDIELFGEPLVRRRLLRTADVITDARPAFRAMVPVLEDAIDQDFETQGVAGGVRWPDLAASTVARKASSHDSRTRANANRVLQATGTLRGSFKEGASGHVQKVSATELRWGSSVPYGVYHQSRAPRRVIPHRPLQLNDLTKRQLVRLLQATMFGEGRVVA